MKIGGHIDSFKEEYIMVKGQDMHRTSGMYMIGTFLSV